MATSFFDLDYSLLKGQKPYRRGKNRCKLCGYKLSTGDHTHLFIRLWGKRLEKQYLDVINENSFFDRLVKERKNKKPAVLIMRPADGIEKAPEIIRTKENLKMKYVFNLPKRGKGIGTLPEE